MRRPLIIPVLVVVTALASSLVLASAELPPSLAAKVNAAPVVVRASSSVKSEGQADIKGLHATFYVAAPKERVLQTLWDTDRFLKIFPDIKSLDVLARRERSVDVKFTVDAVLATVSYTLRRDLDEEAGTIRWREIGGDLKAVRGGWKVEASEHPGVSRVTYSSFVDIGRFVPDSMVRDKAIDKVNEMAGRVRGACVKAP